MFNLLKKKTPGETAIFKISGLHCTSCSMNIDGALEDTEGVKNSETNYAKATTTVTYDPAVTNKDALKSVIEKLEYGVE